MLEIKCEGKQLRIGKRYLQNEHKRQSNFYVTTGAY